MIFIIVCFVLVFECLCLFVIYVVIFIDNTTKKKKRRRRRRGEEKELNEARYFQHAQPSLLFFVFLLVSKGFLPAADF